MGARGYLVLAVAGQGEPKSQLALAQHLGVDRTAMTYLLDDLEAAGLVERRPDPADRRARRVTLTDAGQARRCERGEGRPARTSRTAARAAGRGGARRAARAPAPPRHERRPGRPL